MKKKIYFLFILAITHQYCSAQSNECDALVKYRDEELLHTYDSIVKMYNVKAGNMNWIKEMKQEAMDESKWEASNAVGVIKIINTICNGIQNTIGIASPQGNIIKMAKQVHSKKLQKAIRNKQQYFDAFKKGISYTQKLVSEDIEEKFITDAIVEELGVIGNIYSLFADMKKDYTDFKDWRQLRVDVSVQLDMFDKSINSYRQKLDIDKPKIEQVIKYNEYITEYLNLNCRNVNKDKNSMVERKPASAIEGPLLATYQDNVGQWIAIGPYMTTQGFATQEQAINSLFYSKEDLTLLTDKGKYTIYKLNVKVEHGGRDVRSILTGLGVLNIPDK